MGAKCCGCVASTEAVEEIIEADRNIMNKISVFFSPRYKTQVEDPWAAFQKDADAYDRAAAPSTSFSEAVKLVKEKRAVSPDGDPSEFYVTLDENDKDAPRWSLAQIDAHNDAMRQIAVELFVRGHKEALFAHVREDVVVLLRETYTCSKPSEDALADEGNVMEKAEVAVANLLRSSIPQPGVYDGDDAAV